jgi:predicted nucleic acid-binding Zn ribbon protein
VAASLGPLAASLGAPAPDVLGRLFAGWEQVVGPDVAAHARPVSLRDGVLLLSVDHPAWATQLGYLRSDLLARIGAAIGSETVTELRIRVAHSPRN